MSFKPLSYLEDAVITKDVKDIRIAILSYIKKCLGDTQEIEDAVSYIRKSLSDLEYQSIWEKYDGLFLDNNKNNWNKNYFASMEVDLADNLSKERFNHILEVGKYVYGSTQPIKSTVNTNRSNAVNNKEENKNFLMIALVGGAALLLGIPVLIKIMKK